MEPPEAPPHPLTWFSSLFGFDESADGSDAAYARVQRLLRVESEHAGTAMIGAGEPLHLVSAVNGARFPVGAFSSPTLRELRAAGLLDSRPLPDLPPHAEDDDTEAPDQSELFED